MDHYKLCQTYGQGFWSGTSKPCFPFLFQIHSVQHMNEWHHLKMNINDDDWCFWRYPRIGQWKLCQINLSVTTGTNIGFNNFKVLLWCFSNITRNVNIYFISLYIIRKKAQHKSICHYRNWHWIQPLQDIIWIFKLLNHTFIYESYLSF